MESVGETTPRFDGQFGASVARHGCMRELKWDRTFHRWGITQFIIGPLYLQVTWPVPSPRKPKEGRYSISLMRGQGYWGWSDTAVDFGIGELHAGPVKLQITWPVVWPY